MKKKSVYVVFHTTESGADYKVSQGFKNRSEATEWEYVHREEFERPLIIRKISY